MAFTLAVVGVMVSLAVFFIVHTAYTSMATRHFGLNIDVDALGLMALALWALLYLKLGVVSVIAACALAGMGLHGLG